jgi:hypothetical protein
LKLSIAVDTVPGVLTTSPILATGSVGVATGVEQESGLVVITSALKVLNMSEVAVTHCLTPAAAETANIHLVKSQLQTLSVPKH